MDDSSSSLDAVTTAVEAAAAAAVLLRWRIARWIVEKKPRRRRQFLKEWSLAPSIFNIKAQGLAHCLHWIKLIKMKFAGFIFNLLNLILLSCKKIISSSWFFNFSRSLFAVLTVTALFILLLQ